MKDIPLNVKIECIDGNCGKSSHVTIDLSNQSITHIVVESDDFLGSSMRLVTLDKIVGTTPKSILLSCTILELAAMEKFTETHYIDPASTEYTSSDLCFTEIFNELDPYSMMSFYRDVYPIPMEEERIPAGEIAVHRQADVEATDGYIGRIKEFVIDPSNGHITNLVIQRGHLWNKRELTLPWSAISQMDEYEVRLNLDKKTVRDIDDLFCAVSSRSRFKGRRKLSI